MTTDDERLLQGEVRRALARLRAIRKILGDLHAKGEISIEAHNRLIQFTHEDQG